MEKPTAVRFVTSHMPYRAGEIAGFPLAEAKHLCETLKVAELVEKAAGKGEKPKDEPPQGGETQKGEQKPQGGETQKGEQKPQGGETQKGEQKPQGGETQKGEQKPQGGEKAKDGPK